MNRILLLAGLTLSLLASSGLPCQTTAGAIRKGPWQTASKVPQGWIVHNTKNYHVQSEAGQEKAERLGAHMEIMNDVYRKMFRPDKAGAKQQTIKLFKEEAGMHRYNTNVAGAAAYYSSGDREMVCYDTGKWMDEKKAEAAVTGPETPLERIARRMRLMDDAWKMDLLGCAAHEGWHQYFHWYVGSQVSLPSWINEGMGDYFYTAAPKQKLGRKQAPVSLGNTFDGRLMILQAAKRQDRMEPLEKFLGMHQQEYYSNPSICYAQGWALCQFLLHGADGKYAKVIPTYIRLVANDTNTENVTKAAFKSLDLAELEAEFKAWIDQQKPSPQAAADAEAEAAMDADPSEPVKPPEPAPTPKPPGEGGGTGGLSGSQQGR